MCIMCVLLQVQMVRTTRLISAADVAAFLAKGVNGRPKSERARHCAEMLKMHNPTNLTPESLVKRFEACGENDHRSLTLKDGKVWFFNPIEAPDDAWPYVVLPLPSEEMHADIAREVGELEAQGKKEAGNTVADVLARASKTVH